MLLLQLLLLLPRPKVLVVLLRLYATFLNATVLSSATSTICARRFSIMRIP